MRLDLYQAETAPVAAQQQERLEQACAITRQGRTLYGPEQSGVLHVLQVLIENAIGKAKQLLKARGRTAPVSAYDAFAALADSGLIAPADWPAWNAAVGLRNRIVHDYMNIDMQQVRDLVLGGRYRHVVDFLIQRFE